jgi:hypothetical protein
MELIMRTALLAAAALALLAAPVMAATECRPVAVGGDGIADNVAVQLAFDTCGATGGDVVIDQVFDIESRWAQPIGNPWRFMALVVTANAKPLTIRAENGGGFRAIGDWYGGTGFLLALYKTGPLVTLRDLYLDMSQRCAGIDEEVQNCRDEQQHALELDYGAQNVLVDRLIVFHPSLGPSAGGDCIRLLGGYTDADLVRNVLIHQFIPLACDRSPIGFQRSVRNVLIDGLVSVGNTDNDIDMEATGVDPNDEATWIQDVTVRNAFILKPGGNAITTGRGIRIHVEDSTVLGGGIFSVSCRDCTFEGNTLLQAAGSNDAPIGAIRSNERLKIIGNRLGRLTGSTSTEALLYVSANNGFYPRDTLILGNSFEVAYNAPAIRLENADATIIGNAFTFTGPLPTTQNSVAINVRSLAGTLVPAGAIITANRFTGLWDVAVQVSGVATGLVGAVTVAGGNVFDGARVALRCLNWALAYPVAPVRVGNWKTPASLDECPIATSGY